jgi:hypothetical protein
VGADRRSWRRDVLLVVILLLVGGTVKGWLLARSQVLARDGVGYIEYAARLEQEPLGQVLRTEQQHPLYPLSVLAVHRMTLPFTGDQPASLHWQFSAQLANLIAGVLLAVPMYFLGKELFDRRVGFWGALLFQVLPVPARVTADTLTEGTYLLWVAMALLLAVQGLRTRSLHWFILAGLSGGLAYLVRPEGALIIVLTGVVLLFMQVVRAWRMPWSQAAKCAISLGLAGALTAAPYWYTIGGLTNKPSSLEFLKTLKGKLASVSPTPELGDGLLLASRFSDGTDGIERDSVGPLFALYEVLDEVCKGFYYVTWIPVVGGLTWYRRRVASSPGLLLLLLVMAVSLLVLWQLAMKVHYVSERHTLLIVLCGSILGVATMFHWAAQLGARPGMALSPTWQKWFGHRRRWRFAFQVGMLSLLALGLIQTLKPLHKHRLGHKMVGLWLTCEMKPGDKFTDPYGLASFYADQRLSLRPEPTDPASRKAAHRYLLVEPADRDLHRCRQIEHEKELMGAAEVVFTWPNADQPELILYRSNKRRVLSSGAAP